MKEEFDGLFFTFVYDTIDDIWCIFCPSPYYGKIKIECFEYINRLDNDELELLNKRINDYTPIQARKLMMDAVSKLTKQQNINNHRRVSNASNSNDNNNNSVDLLQVYKNICIHFPPVLHKFFLEKYSNPLLWFNSRLRYIRSCSVNCIVGYVLGLGDRHTQNILLDKNNCEMIHIDLGVAFDQGKLLKTPELVPFRLTRDIYDGFGLQGLNGTFKKSCIKVLNLLREQQSMFYTVLQVFIHDPLYKWSLSPEKMKRLQYNSNNDNNDTQSNDNSNNSQQSDVVIDNIDNQIGDGNKQAMRALDILKQKFRGFEHGYTLSVEGQVNRLIAEATDENNLSKMFHGWAAWM